MEATLDELLVESRVKPKYARYGHKDRYRKRKINA